MDNNFIRDVGTIDQKLANGDGIWLDNGNSDDTIRNNVITDVMGNSILLEANSVGTNTVKTTSWLAVA